MKQIRVRGSKALITISIEADLVRRIDDLADLQNMNRSQMIERAVRAQISDDETMVKAFTNPIVFQALSGMFGQPGVLKEMARAAGDELDEDQMRLFREALDGLGNTLSSPGSAAAVTVRKPARGTKPASQAKRRKGKP